MTSLVIAGVEGAVMEGSSFVGAALRPFNIATLLGALVAHHIIGRAQENNIRAGLESGPTGPKVARCLERLQSLGPQVNKQLLGELARRWNHFSDSLFALCQDDNAGLRRDAAQRLGAAPALNAVLGLRGEQWNRADVDRAWALIEELGGFATQSPASINQQQMVAAGAMVRDGTLSPGATFWSTLAARDDENAEALLARLRPSVARDADAGVALAAHLLHVVGVSPGVYQPALARAARSLRDEE